MWAAWAWWVFLTACAWAESGVGEGVECPCGLEPAYDNVPGGGEGNLLWNCRDLLLPEVPTACWAIHSNVTQVTHTLSLLRYNTLSYTHILLPFLTFLYFLIRTLYFLTLFYSLIFSYTILLYTFLYSYILLSPYSETLHSLTTTIFQVHPDN
ncbi:hypothetical protein E2C01_049333 [Portunus trituberculatus]|uniref:Uncharacterized protein n=1 Tax=Portunus trituberculatus TaxID=210409 RepID=A0A5B7GE54_PORTR|nr:hypothetical protein [Portunus trituberculatus]